MILQNKVCATCVATVAVMNSRMSVPKVLLRGNKEQSVELGQEEYAQHMHGRFDLIVDQKRSGLS